MVALKGVGEEGLEGQGRGHKPPTPSDAPLSGKPVENNKNQFAFI